jgi:hypothetical protein
MNCLSSEQLAMLALGNPREDREESEAVRDHLSHCPRCALALERLQEDLQRVVVAHDWFEQGHAAARARLLAALPGGEVERGARPRKNPLARMKEVLTMRRMWIGGTAAVVVVGLFLAWLATGSSSALAQTARALREVESYRCRLSGVEAGADEAKDTQEVGILSWAAPGFYRMEVRERGKPINVSVLIRGRPGLEIDHKYETFKRLEPLYQADSPLELLHELARFAGKADRELPVRKLAGKAARGFEIGFDKIDSDCDGGTVRVWTDPETKLPLRVELEMAEVFKMIMDDFAWNIPTEKLFDTKPPAKYQDETPAPMSPEEETTQIVKALKVYARYCGKYPPVKIVYGDVTSDRLFKTAGLSNPHKVLPREEQLTEAYAECSPARYGFAVINSIQRHNPDAAYYGKTVGPDDKGKVLFRWKRADGDYQVLFGDLRAATVTPGKLADLEKR